MRTLSTIFFLALLSSNLIGCASKDKNRRLLSERAKYEKEMEGLDMSLNVKRKAARVSKVWVFPHDLPTGDYFLGSWVMLKYGTESWDVEQFNNGGK